MRNNIKKKRARLLPSWKVDNFKLKKKKTNLRQPNVVLPTNIENMMKRVCNKWRSSKVNKEIATKNQKYSWNFGDINKDLENLTHSLGILKARKKQRKISEGPT